MFTMIFPSLAVYYDGFGKEHDRNAEDGCYYEYDLERSLVWPEENVLGVIVCHVDEYSNHCADDGRSQVRILIAMHPLIDDQIVHIDKRTGHEDELRKGQYKDI